MENMPLVVQSFILALLLYGLPVSVGGCLSSMARKDSGSKYSLPFLWIGGQMILWAVFQLVCVPFVLKEKEFHQVVTVFGSVSGLLAVIGIVVWFADHKKKLHVVTGEAVKKNYLWIVFGVLLVFQLVQAVGLAYGDGDDAYYVAVSTITEDAETMYRKLPYTGGSAEVDIRHGLAPFPIWIAFLSRISGIRAVSVAHVAMPLMLISMTYGIFYLLGREIFRKREKMLAPFMVMTAMLVLFGDYSMYTMEHFMLARSRQGKAALGSIVFPMVLFMLLLLLNRLQEKKKISLVYWGLLCCVMLTGCLCSTMGAFLLCLMIAVTGLCAAISYRSWKVLIPMALCCAPCVCYMLLYVLS